MRSAEEQHALLTDLALASPPGGADEARATTCWEKTSPSDALQINTQI